MHMHMHAHAYACICMHVHMLVHNQIKGIVHQTPMETFAPWRQRAFYNVKGHTPSLIYVYIYIYNSIIYDIYIYILYNNCHIYITIYEIIFTYSYTNL